MPSRACRCVAPCGVASAGSWGRRKARTIARPTVKFWFWFSANHKLQPRDDLLPHDGGVLAD